MLYDPYTLDQGALHAQLTRLIESERDLKQPRHIALTRMINELSVTGFPLLIDVARAFLDEDRDLPKTWISAPLRSALERARSSVERPGPVIERRFSRLEEEHLLKQLHALMIDLELLLMLSDADELSRLRTTLWIGATRHLLARADEERDQRLRSLLSCASDELGGLALVPARLEREASDVLAERLRLCYAGGGVLSLILPSDHDEALITQLKESGLALDLRGVERLELEGYGVIGWLDGVERGLDEVRSIEALMLSDEDVEGLRSRGLLERVEVGWSAPLVIDEVAGVEFKMVRCPAGEFWMGVMEPFMDEYYGLEFDENHHKVMITRPFLIGQTQVTQAQWSAIMGSNPSYFEGADLPVECVNWTDCVHFCNALSVSAGLEPVYDIEPGDEVVVSVHVERTGYRLPTEAEWEYMTKAGAELTYSGSNDINEVAWYTGLSINEGTVQDHRPRPVAQKKPNSWGIYDCSGNIEEWCSDEYIDDIVYGDLSALARDPHEWDASAYQHVQRGGYWGGDADDCRVAYRSYDTTIYPRPTNGLRVLRRA